MIGRRLARRLERLETRLAPAGEPLVVQIRYVSPDGSGVDGARFIIPRTGRRPGLADWQNHHGQHP